MHEYKSLGTLSLSIFDDEWMPHKYAARRVTATDTDTETATDTDTEADTDRGTHSTY